MGLSFLFGACGDTSHENSATQATKQQPKTAPTILPPGSPLGNTLSEVPKTTGSAASSQSVHVLKEDPTTVAQLVTAFTNYEGLPSTCPAQIVKGDLWIATQTDTGISWAIAAFQPAPTCVDTGKDVYGRPLPPTYIRPFDIIPPPPTDIFERQAGQLWVDNAETGKPFPCKATIVGGTGPGRAAVPADVLSAWKMPYYSDDCLTYTPPAP